MGINISSLPMVDIQVTSNSFDSCDSMDYSPRLLCPWNFPGKNTGVGCISFSRGIFPTQGSNLYLLHCQAGA